MCDVSTMHGRGEMRRTDLVVLINKVQTSLESRAVVSNGGELWRAR